MSLSISLFTPLSKEFGDLSVFKTSSTKRYSFLKAKGLSPLSTSISVYGNDL